MQIVEKAKIQLVIDGADAAANELTRIGDAVKDLTAKRNEHQRGSKEWKEYNDQLREQEKLYKAVEQRIDINSMSLKQLTRYQKELRSEIRDLEPGSEAFVKVAGRLKDVNSRVEEVNGSIRATSKEVSSSEGLWSKAKTWMLGAFSVAAITAFFSKVVDLGKQIFDITAKFEKYETVLKNALGGQEEAAAAMEMIKELAKTTPIGVDEMTGSFIKMVNRGLQPTSEELKKLADLAASQGKGFDQLTEAVLDAMMGEGERLKEFGIKMKKEGDNVSLMFKGQTVTVKKNEEAIYDAIVAMGSYQGVAGVTSDVSEGLEGKLGNLGDAWDFLLVTVGEKLKPVFQWLLTTLANVIDWLSDNIHLMEPYKAAWVNLKEALQMAWSNFTKILDVFDTGEKKIFTLGNIVRVLSTSFSILGTAIKAAVSIVQVLIDSMLVLGNAGTMVFKVLKGDFAGAGRDAIALGERWNKLKENASKNFDSITSVYKKIWDTNGAAMDDASKKVDMYGKMVKAGAAEAGKLTEEQLKAANEARKKAAQEAEKIEKERQKKFAEYEKEYLQGVEQSQKKRAEFSEKTDKLIKDGLSSITKFRELHLKGVEDRYKLNGEVINNFLTQQQQDNLRSIAFLALSNKEADEKELLAKELFKTSYIKLTKEQEEAVNKIVANNLEKRKENIEKSFAIINAVVDTAMNLFGLVMSDKMEMANSNTERALRQNQEMWVNWGAQATSVIQAWMKDWVSGLAATIAWAGQGIANLFTAAKRRRKAELEDLREYYEEQISLWRNFMDGANSDLEKYYGNFLDLVEKAAEYTKELSDYDPKFIIDNEIKRAKAIDDTYQKATTAETKWHNDILKNIDDQHRKRIESIDKEYAAREAKEKQRFDDTTLSIEEDLTKGLIKYLENEESKTSIFAEFNAKRSNILAATSLADMEITEGMDQATIDAINAARDLRNKYLVDLQSWLNEELEFTINNEGQKRKEYSETDKLKNAALEAHEDNEIKFAMAGIQRNKDKNAAYVAAEKEKNNSIEDEKERHDKRIQELDDAKNAAMEASWKIVKDAIIRGYDEMLTKAQDALAAGLLTLEQYRAIVAEVNALNAAMGQAPVTSSTKPAINYDLDNSASKKDEKFMREQGLWAASWSETAREAYREWLSATKKTDTPESRMEFFWNPDNKNKYASGTEYVDQENKYQDGVDTVPSMLTKGERVFKVSHNSELGGYSNDEVVSIVRNHRRLQGLAIANVTTRSAPLIHAIKNSSISRTGEVKFASPGTTANIQQSSWDSSAVENILLRISEKLDTLEEIKDSSKALERKPVLSMERIFAESKAESLNISKSVFK